MKKKIEGRGKGSLFCVSACHTIRDLGNICEQALLQSINCTRALFSSIPMFSDLNPY